MSDLSVVSLKSISHYKITGTLGQGGMGVVYKAFDQKLQRTVAIKTLPPEKQSDEKPKKRLMSEALAASRLNHPNICTIYEVDQVDDQILIAMEYVEGHSLSDEIHNGPIEIDKALDIAIQTTGALDKAHRSGIIHRDIKPSNIALTKEGSVKILDFALAYAGLGHVYGQIHSYYDQDPAWMKKGIEECQQAIKIEPNLPEALSARALLYYGHAQYDDAIRYAKMALDQKQDCEGAYYTLGFALHFTDRIEEASQLADSAIEFNGDDFNVYVAYESIFSKLGNQEKTRRLYLQHIRVLQRHLEWARENVRARILLAGCFAGLGRQEEAIVELQNVLASSPDDAHTLYNAACTYALLGRKKEAIGTIKKALENGYWHLDMIARDADFKILHDEPEFQAILKRTDLHG